MVQEPVRITQMCLCDAIKRNNRPKQCVQCVYTIYRIKRICFSWSMASLSKELSDKTRCLRVSVATYLLFLAVHEACVV